jgi:hypothetical protein
MSHVFISYVREDSVEVEQLAADLRARGAEVWLDKEQLMPGVRWQTAIRRAIEEGVFFIACFSENLFKRERAFMNEKITLAIDELRKRQSGRPWFLPVLLSTVELPDREIGGGQTLRDIQYVSLYDDWDEGIKRLLAVIEPEATAREREARLRDTEEPLQAERKPTPTGPTGSATETTAGLPRLPRPPGMRRIRCSSVSALTAYGRSPLPRTAASSPPGVATIPLDSGPCLAWRSTWALCFTRDVRARTSDL